jgi:hypothetical protein
LLAVLGQRLNWEIITVDMNPDAIASKIRSQSVSNVTLSNIKFRKGISISTQEIEAFYDRELTQIGGIPFAEAISASITFIDTSLDARKAPSVARALGLDEFNVPGVLSTIQMSKRIPSQLLRVYRTTCDELEFHVGSAEPVKGCMQEIMDSSGIDAVFLDSGEFSSMPEWEIVVSRLRPGGYVILHDIFFPKSFKNWLVCGSISANPAYEILYIDRSTPQGLMVAQKKLPT